MGNMESLLVLRTGIAPRNREHVLEHERQQLAQVGAELRLVSCASSDELIDAARHAHGILHPPSARVPISRRIIEHLDKCRVIAAVSIGTDHIDVNACTQRGIVIANLGGVYTDEVADHTMALLLACSRKITAFDQCIRAGRWQDQWALRPGVPRLRNMTLGLLAFGRIARAVAKRADSFGMRVLAYDPLLEDNVFQEHGVERTELDDLLAKADVLSIHLPLTDRTRGMVNARALRLLKPGAILINTARGAIVDQVALVQALQEGRIASAGIDVFETEPVDENHPLVKLQNVVLTPHVGAVSDASAEELRIRPVAQVVRVLQGLPPHPEAFVNPEVWKNCTI
jgi:D-3-phosphoglycerate dehydrogenase